MSAWRAGVEGTSTVLTGFCSAAQMRICRALRIKGVVGKGRGVRGEGLWDGMVGG